MSERWPKRGDVPVHGAIDLDLAEGVGEVVVTADDVGDVHVVVVDDDGVEVGGGAVAAEDDQVVDLGVGDSDLALDEVVDEGFAVAGGAEADDGLDAGGGFGRVAVAPGAVVAGGAAFGGGLLAHLAEFFGGAVAIVGAATGEHLVGDLGVARLAGGLEDGGLVGGEVEPGKAAEDGLGVGLGAAFAVGVLDAEEVFAAVVAGEEVVEEGGAGTADVEQAGGAGGEAGADGRHGGCLSRCGGA